MKITWLGHATVLIEGSKTVLIDPFFTGNPAAATQLSDLPPIDLVLCTHDHFDHSGDLLAVCKQTGAPFVGQYELAERTDIKAMGVTTVGMNVGGTYQVSDGLSVALTPAIHSASTGGPTGVIVTMDGKKLYHTGDTEVFSDMALIRELHGPFDVVCVPIGGHFTMDVRAASRAVEFLVPRVAIPIHYNTWPLIEADPLQLQTGAAHRVILQPGEAYSLED